MDTSDSTVKYIPYKESECGEAAGLTAGIAYPENWQEQVGVSYEIKSNEGVSLMRCLQQIFATMVQK